MNNELLRFTLEQLKNPTPETAIRAVLYHGACPNELKVKFALSCAESCFVYLKTKEQKLKVREALDLVAKYLANPGAVTAEELNISAAGIGVWSIVSAWAARAASSAAYAADPAAYYAAHTANATYWSAHTANAAYWAAQAANNVKLNTAHTANAAYWAAQAANNIKLNLKPQLTLLVNLVLDHCKVTNRNLINVLYY